MSDDQVLVVENGNRSGQRSYHESADCRAINDDSKTRWRNRDEAEQRFQPCQHVECYGPDDRREQVDVLTCPRCGTDTKSLPLHLRACDGDAPVDTGAD